MKLWGNVSFSFCFNECINFFLKKKGYGINARKTAIHPLFAIFNNKQYIYLRMKHFSGLTFIRYARGQNIGSPVNNIDHYTIEITKQDQNSETKICNI